MNNSKLLSIADFSKISRTSKDALRYYDEINLLSPICRSDNKYRYYSIRQLATCNTIRLLQKVGLALSEIKNLKNHRTPRILQEILHKQVGELHKKRDRIDRALLLLHTTIKTIQSGVNVDEDIITIQYIPAEQIILGAWNDYSGSRTDYDALHDFFMSMQEKSSDTEYDSHYPVWGIYSEDRVKKGDFLYPDRYYFYNPAGQNQRPAAMYAIGYMRTGYGENGALFKRMKEYIDANGFEIYGDAYEEYPLNEICISDDANYLMRLMITVHKSE